MCGTRACPMHAFVMQSRFAEAHGEGGSGWSSAHGCSACTLRAVGRSKFYFVHVGVSRAIHTLDRTSKNRTVLYCRVACLPGTHDPAGRGSRGPFTDRGSCDSRNLYPPLSKTMSYVMSSGAPDIHIDRQIRQRLASCTEA